MRPPEEVAVMTSMNSPSAPQKPKLLDCVREAILYREVLQQDLPWLEGVVRAKRPIRLPVVLTREEVDDLHARSEPRACSRSQSSRPASLDFHVRKWC